MAKIVRPFQLLKNHDRFKSRKKIAILILDAGDAAI